MALRDKLKERVQPLLEPGEQIEQVFLAQSGPNPNLTFVTYLVMFMNKYFVVAVTDRAVVLCNAGMMTPSKPKAIAERLPRQTRIGPVAGTLWSRTNLPGGKTWVHRRFYHDVEAADSALTT